MERCGRTCRPGDLRRVPGLHAAADSRAASWCSLPRLPGERHRGQRGRRAAARVSHNKGTPIRPEGEYSYTVPHQLATCLTEYYGTTLFPGNQDISLELRGDVEQATVGGSGGEPYELSATTAPSSGAWTVGVGSLGNLTVVTHLTARDPVNGGSYSRRTGGAFSTSLNRSCPSG